MALSQEDYMKAQRAHADSIECVSPKPTITVITSEHTLWFGVLSCGHRLYEKNIYVPPSFNIGDSITCATCIFNRSEVERLREFNEPMVRARLVKWCGVESYKLYRRDSSTPTGVSLITSFPAIPEIDALLREKGISPLSPTEREAR